jgi:tetratricopeptide (TPR) repeat protein
MLLLFSSVLEKIRRRRGRVVAGLVVLGILTTTGVGLRLGDPWHWWRREPPREAVREHWEQAQRAVEERDFLLARKHLDRCLEVCPVNAQAQFLMARTCRRQGDVDAWEQHLKMAEWLAWPPEEIVLERQLRKAASGNSWSVEQALLDQLNHLPPEEVLILESLVNGYLNNVRYIDAIEFTTTWLQRHPGDWLAYLYRGRAYQSLSIYEQAIEEYQEALKLHPDFLMTQLWLADTLLASRQYERALKHYQIYLQAAPNEADILLAMAMCQASLGKPEVRATLDKLLAEHPNYAGGLLLAAKLDLVEDKPDQALRRARRAIELSPNDPEIVYVFAQALSRLNRKDEAEQFKKEHYKLFGQADQLFSLKKRIEVEPKDASLRHQAGILCLDIGQEKEAFGWFQSALWIDPNHRRTHQALADYWKKHGQLERAARHRHKAKAE